MLSLEAILELDKTQASIKKIDLFLTSQVKLSDEYMIALSYKGQILHTLGKNNDALRLLLPFINDFKIMSYKSCLAIADVIINIYLDDSRFDEAIKYINLKKNYLPFSKLHLFLKDNIKLYLKMDDKKKAKEALITYLNDDLSKEESIYAKEELSKIYLDEKQYDKYLELSKSLEDYYSENVYLDKVALIHLKRLEISFLKGNYLKVIGDGNKFLEETSRVDFILICASICIRAYIELKDYKKAGIFESYYEDYATKEHPKEALLFSEASLELYRKTNSLVSIKEYENRVKELEDYLKPEEKKKKAKRVNNEELLVADLPKKDIKPAEAFVTPNISILNPSEIHHKQRVTIVPKPKDIKNLTISNIYKQISEIIEECNNLSLDIKFRELYRRLLIMVKRKLKIEEAYLLYYNKDYLGLYFKSDRAYDYKLDFSEIEDSINYAAMRYDDELMLDLNDEAYNLDIRGKNYSDLEYAISFPLHSKNEVIGSITYYSNEDFSEELIYECLKLISSLINNRLNLSYYLEDINLNNQKLYFIKENMSSGLKEESEGYIHSSFKAQMILGISENVTEAFYIMNMKSNDISRYKQIHEEIYKLMPVNLELQYDYNNKGKWIRVNERYYPENIDGTIHIYSLIDDITKDYNDKEDLINLAYNNPISGMQTEVKLQHDLNEEMPHERLALALCELADFSIYKEIYGYNFSNQLIYALSLGLKEAFSKDFMVSLYHMERDRFAILFKEANDKRLIDSKLKNAFIKASKSLNKLNKRLNVSFNCGVFRLGRGTRIKDYSEVIKYAHDALYDSIELDGPYPHIAHYNSDISKERLRRNLLVTHISEAIDSNKIGITYQQIVNLKEQAVFGYNAIINLDNLEVDREYMNMVIDRRGLRARVDRYSLNRLFIEERMLYDKLKGYIPMFLYLHNDSIDSFLYEYINTLLNHYKVEPFYITFIADSTNNIVLQKLRELGFNLASYDILDVYRGSTNFLIYSYHDVGVDSIDEVRELCNKHDCRCILGGIDNKDDIKMAASKEYDLIYGAYYKKLNRIGSIISKIEE